MATALPLLAVNISRDPLAIAGVVAAQHLPWIAVALGWRLVAGVDRRTVIGLVGSSPSPKYSSTLSLNRVMPQL